MKSTEKKEVVQEAPKTQKDMTVEQLESAGFRLREQLDQLQGKLQIIRQEISTR